MTMCRRSAGPTTEAEGGRQAERGRLARRAENLYETGNRGRDGLRADLMPTAAERRRQASAGHDRACTTQGVWQAGAATNSAPVKVVWQAPGRRPPGMHAAASGDDVLREPGDLVARRNTSPLIVVPPPLRDRLLADVLTRRASAEHIVDHIWRKHELHTIAPKLCQRLVCRA